MEHRSHPGFYDAPLSPDGARRLARVADVMIPAVVGFPPAGETVVPFVSEWIDPAERDLLERAMERIDDGGDAEIASWVSGVEQCDPETFVLLRNWVYFGYYSLGIVAAALKLAGSRYHGAPQPFGYRLDQDAPVPSTSRGSYLTTDEIRRVGH